MKSSDKQGALIFADAESDSLEWKWEAFAERHLADKVDWVDEGEQWMNDAPRRDATVLKRDVHFIRRKAGENKYVVRRWTRGDARD